MNKFDDDNDYDDNEQRRGQKQDKEQEPEPEILIPLTLDNTTGLTQLQIDAINVFENRVSIDSFPKEYQMKIKNYYRFSPIGSSGSSVKASGGSRNFWK